jgi:hypothetical protein
LGRERLVGLEDQSGALHVFNEPRDRRRFATAGNAFKCLEPKSIFDAQRERGDGSWLVARRLKK